MAVLQIAGTWPTNRRASILRSSFYIARLRVETCFERERPIALIHRSRSRFGIQSSTPRQRISRREQDALVLLQVRSPARLILEPALADEHGITGAERRAGRDHKAPRSGRIGVRDRDAIAPRARRETAGNGYRALDRHVGHV